MVTRISSGLLVAAVTGTVWGQLDCSGVPEWESKIYVGGEMSNMATVWYEGSKYKQQWYADVNDKPGVLGGPWLAEGPCIDGSMHEGGPGDLPGHDDIQNPKVDCSSFKWWSGAETYSNFGNQVVFGDKLWRNDYWTQSDVPGKEVVWVLQGVCAENTIPPPPVRVENPQLDALVCSCCKECAHVEVTGPQCKPLVDGECYFTDCRKINSYNPGVCEDYTSGNKYMYYPGEIVAAKSQEWPKKVYVPYVDGGLYPPPRLTEIARETGVKYFNIAFVQSAQTTNDLNGCHGAIAGMSIDQGPIAWDEVQGKNLYMWDDVNSLREYGGDIIISFGGAAGIELADRAECREGDVVKNLVDAYSHIIDFLKLSHIDFDIEGAAAAKNNRETGWKYRFDAVKILKQKYPYLKVWWTLPVLPAGLVDDGQMFIHDLLVADVPMDILNVMNMDYGDDVVCAGNLMGPCERSAMENVARQVFTTAQQLGKLQTRGWTNVDDVYPNLGSTPMLGMNDVTTEIYYISDAKESLQEWQTRKPLGLVSNWSLARDDVCGSKITYVDLTCSGAPDQTKKYEFASVFNAYTG